MADLNLTDVQLGITSAPLGAAAANGEYPGSTVEARVVNGSSSVLVAPGLTFGRSSGGAAPISLGRISTTSPAALVFTATVRAARSSWPGACCGGACLRYRWRRCGRVRCAEGLTL
jgi:hypothetical protein